MAFLGGLVGPVVRGLDGHEVLNLADHAPDGLGVLEDHRVVEPPQAQTTDGGLLGLGAVDGATNERHLELVGHVALLHERGQGHAALGSDLTTDELFGDWAVTNYLNSIGRAAEPWTYNGITVPPITASATHTSFPAEATAAVKQYGVDYIVINADEPVTLDFEGSTTVPLE